MTVHVLPPPSVRPARLDLFLPVHKGLRLALADLVVRMGQADFSDERAAGDVVDHLRRVTAFCDDHKRAEDAILLPALLTRLTGDLPNIAHAHESQARHVEELSATADALLAAPPGARAVVGRTLYLHFASFAGENLAHMTEEEQVLSPLFERLFSEEEVRALHADVMTFLDRAAHGRGAPYILRALTRHERVGLVMGAIATMPKADVLALVDVVRPALGDADLADLLARTGLAS